MDNLYEIAAMFGFSPDEHLFVEITPIDLYTCQYRFSNTEDGTCFYFKIQEFEMITGGIIMWHGLLADIPPSYAICDGNNGTPDLREKFVIGTANAIDPGGTGGSVNHTHDFTGDGHNHTLDPGLAGGGGAGHILQTTTNPATGTTDAEDGRPPFYEIAFIMKL